MNEVVECYEKSEELIEKENRNSFIVIITDWNQTGGWMKKQRYSWEILRRNEAWGNGGAA